MTDEGYSGPRYSVSDLTDDQRAMLALLGGVEARERRVMSFWYETPTALAKLAPDGMPGGVVKDHACPVVQYRDALRIIYPNGDVSTVNDDLRATAT